MTQVHSRGWLMSLGWLALAACGTASAPDAGTPAPTSTASGPTPMASLDVPAPQPTTTVSCPAGQEHQPGKGCVYAAEGTPPTGKGATMRPVPRGRTADEPEGTLVQSFWIDERGATTADYQACMKAGACAKLETIEGCDWKVAGKEGEAVNCVSWHHAKAYCAWAGKRLPTDAEWDRAAAKHEDYGITGLGGQLASWIGHRYCSEAIGGCGRAYPVRGHDKPAARDRYRPEHAYTWFGVRCAWSETAPPAPGEPVPLLPLRISTPGQILCNTTLCDLSTSVCCHNTKDGLGRCVPKGKRMCRSPELHTECDEHADCGGGKNCCPYWGCSWGCDEERVCIDGPCEQGGEICLPGGQCRPGFKCGAEPGARRGRCGWDDRGAWCGTKRCSGDERICCLPEGKSVGYCTKGDCKPKERTLHCASPRDCGGATCGANVVMGAPPEVNDGSLGCIGVSHMLSIVACDTLQDCPRHPPTGTEPKACRHTKGLPRGVKECIYFDDAP